jgi:hypothetical protein
MIAVVKNVVLMQMSLKLPKLINVRLFLLPFFCIGHIQEILQQIFDAFIYLVGNLDYIILHDLYPLKLALLYLVNIQHFL